MSDTKELKEDIKKYAKLQSLANTEGGKDLIKGLRADVITAIDSIGSSYLDAPEANLRALCARLKERIELLRVLYNAPKNKKFLTKMLDEILESDPE